MVRIASIPTEEQAPEAAALDANVIFGGGLRDFLLCAAFEGAFVPAWSDELHDEWVRNRARHYGDDRGRLAYTMREMEAAFPGANMEPDEKVLADVLALCRTDAERKDAHVIMTAVIAEAATIVTLNVSDFPDRILSPFGLRKERPDGFCSRILPGRQARFVAAARRHRQLLEVPRRDPDDYLRHLSDVGLPGTSALLRPHADLLW